MRDPALKRLAQRLIRALGGYELFRILERDPATATPPPLTAGLELREIDDAGREALLRSNEPKPRQLASDPLVAGAAMLALWQGAVLLGVALFEPAGLPWIAGIWPGAEGMALTDLWVLAGVRQQGAGRALVVQASGRFQGPQFAWTWWTNRPALRTFHGAGWKSVGWSLKVGRLPRIAWRTARRMRSGA